MADYTEYTRDAFSLRWHDADLHKQESLFSSYPCEGLKDVPASCYPQAKDIIP